MSFCNILKDVGQTKTLAVECIIGAFLDERGAKAEKKRKEAESLWESIGIEIVKPAIEDAKKNAKKNHMENTEFYAADAGKLMPQLYRQGLVPDVIVMDPVRAGCSEEVLKAAAGMNPKRIVYVSCNPATFARDAKILKSEGYEIKEIQPMDMFPQTMHVETVCLLSKGKE